MKKLYPLLSVLFLIYWGCENPKEEENTPTEVTLWGEVYSVENTDTIYLNIIGLKGPMPPEIGNLTNLTYLNLGGNQFTGEIPSQIGNLTNLTDLSFGNNQLTGLPPEIGNLTNLTYFRPPSYFFKLIYQLIHIQIYPSSHKQKTPRICGYKCDAVNDFQVWGRRKILFLVQYNLLLLKNQLCRN